MTKESIYELQRIDCNCNDCGFMKRDLERHKSHDDLHTNNRGEVTNPSFRLNYGDCSKFNKQVSFIPNVCQLETQKCFIHRKDFQAW